MNAFFFSWIHYKIIAKRNNRNKISSKSKQTQKKKVGVGFFG
jgi:hypothetical protein